MYKNIAVVAMLVLIYGTIGVWFCAAAGGESTASSQSKRKVEIPLGQRQLFLDDHVVDKVHGLQRVMHSPTKKGAVLKPDTPSDGCLVQSRSAPMWIPDEKVYKMIYIAYTWPDKTHIGPALAVSKDGVNWTKPKFGLVDVYGSKENNRIFLPERFRRMKWSLNKFWNVVYDPDDPNPERRYKGLIGAIGRWPIVSADCITWKELKASKIHSNDESNLTYDRQNKRFIAMLKHSNKYGRASAVSFSKDFVHWTKPKLAFGADAKDQKLAKKIIRERLADDGLVNPFYVDPEPGPGFKRPKGHIPTWKAESYNMAVFPYQGLYIGLPSIYYPTGQRLPQRNNTDGFHQVQLVMTRDSNLMNWKRIGNRQAFIGPSCVEDGFLGIYDRIQIFSHSNPLEKGDKLWFYYTGLKHRCPVYQYKKDGTPRDQRTLSKRDKADIKEGWGAICLAVLRKDGFVSLESKNKEGYVLTKPFIATGTKLILNYVSQDEGQVEVEVLDSAGEVMTGFTRLECVPLEGDSVGQMVVWKTGASWEFLAGQTVQLKIYLLKSDLYSFWID